MQPSVGVMEDVVVSITPRVAYTNPAVLPRLTEADEVSQEALWLFTLHG